MKQFDFDVIVVGGGHAGSEAAHASARMGAKTALVTLSEQGIGVMSCNPAIGGLGKGHLVREIDAFDGVMARVADKAGIQFRLLNRRKGPAVQGPRAQADRKIYQTEMLKATKAQQNLAIIEGEVTDLIVKNCQIAGIELNGNQKLTSQTVILTTGTFLRGIIHIGDRQIAGGRMGEKPSTQLAYRLEEFGLPLGRLKTGTPPRIDGRTINWDGLDRQPGDDDPTMFSFLSSKPTARQIACAITHTNQHTHDIIRKNLDRSAMYGGHIAGIGPRYCPSIEDKIVRFSDKPSHQIFLEPEGLADHTIYPNGISTSLPEEIQEEYVRSIEGLEHAKILQPGYAIEYDYVDPRALNLDLSLETCQGLYFAGQINGTTGYEEAAAQGLVAGINAARRSKGQDSINFSRSNSYIGVMIDDLTSRGVTEPYRMFTSRAEYRLSLRADNADQRLTPLAMELGCVTELRVREFTKKKEKLDQAKAQLDSLSVSSQQLVNAGVDVSRDGARRTGYEALSIGSVSWDALIKIHPNLCDIDDVTREQLSKDALYANYLERQRRDIEALQRDELEEIPKDFPFDEIEGLSNELKAKFSFHRPQNMAQASRIDGVTPSALLLILTRLKSKQIRKKLA
ncbi:tRNA uridine-5-carboxymethylaminomethyl(34) synthesis enzyme MnmG [Marivita sp. S0852]|uniref:tRNA uridine-5-carboxymethylaminomethyl(34) synthesis enzyme MnmG n=1 Tax=Marivita sp. S0852 TaxID=3373893 RepID=UPI003981F6FA